MINNSVKGWCFSSKIEYLTSYPYLLELEILPSVLNIPSWSRKILRFVTKEEVLLFVESFKNDSFQQKLSFCMVFIRYSFDGCRCQFDPFPCICKGICTQEMWLYLISSSWKIWKRILQVPRIILYNCNKFLRKQNFLIQ